MRKKRNQQCSLNFIDAHHEIHEILSGCSQWLDAHPQFVDWVHEELRTDAVHDTGRKALSAESVLRIATCFYDSTCKLIMITCHLF